MSDISKAIESDDYREQQRKLENDEKRLSELVKVSAKKEVYPVWDSVEYDLSGKNTVQVKRGVAEVWKESYPDAGISYEKVETKQSRASRTPQDPLEDNNRGTAFADLKKEKE
jgi:hypothetical protein